MPLRPRTKKRAKRITCDLTVIQMIVIIQMKKLVIGRIADLRSKLLTWRILMKNDHNGMI